MRLLTGIALLALGEHAAAYNYPRQLASNATTTTTTKAPYYEPGENCTVGIDQLYGGYTSDRSVQCYCVTQLRDWLSTTTVVRTVSKTRGVGVTTLTQTTSASTYTTVAANLVTEVYTVTGNYAFANENNFYGSASPPCCSSCTIAAQTVDLFYFPTPAVEGAATSFESNGYTFKSPSVYIGFTSLYAFDFCGTVGSVYSSTTMEFHPTEISTFGSLTATTTTRTQAHDDFSNITPGVITTETNTLTLSVPVATQIDFRDLAQDCDTIEGYTYIASLPLTQLNKLDPCHPVIQLPERIKSLQPGWADCNKNPLGGFYDPPSALTPVSRLQPATSTPVPTPQPAEDPTIVPPAPTSTIPAAPVQTPDPVPQPTTTPKPIEPTPDPQPDTAIQSTVAVSPTPIVPADPPVSNSPVESPGGSPSNPSPVNQTPDPNAPAPSVTSVLVLPPASITIPTAGGVIASQTLTAGAVVTSAGVVFSVISTGSSIVAVVGTQTLIAGGQAASNQGIVYSLPATGGNIIVSVLPTAASDPALGVVIASIFGGSPAIPTYHVYTVTPSAGAGNGTSGDNTTGLPFIEASSASRSGNGLAGFALGALGFGFMVAML
ncbi:hypothetical protein B0O99DRAFT_588689 [Bisporella sp. PMI_857]|nr:hypothetical protein B0O99DRAFT_588689 [Bisporella sp. PMI_857]